MKIKAQEMYQELPIILNGADKRMATNESSIEGKCGRKPNDIQ